MAMGFIKTLFEVKELILIGSLILALVGMTYFIGSSDLITARTIANEVSYMSSINYGDNVEIEIKSQDENLKKFEISSSSKEIIVKSESNDLSVRKNYIGNSKIAQSGDYIVIS